MTPSLFSDSMTVAYKEWHEWFARRARPGWIGLFVLLVIWSTVAPFLLRNVPAGMMLTVLVWLSLPMAVSGVVVADSFAGERERQTLETLLTSRLSDHAIVIGKILAVSGFAVSLLLLDLIPGIAVIATGLVGLEMAPSAGRLALWAVVLGLPLIVLVISAGGVVSLYAYTARQSLLLIVALVGALLLSGAGLVAWATSQQPVGSASPMPGAHLVTFLVLIALDCVLFFWLMCCGHRARLLALG